MLKRNAVYVPLTLGASDNMIDNAVTTRNPHIGEHLKLLTRSVAGNRYNVLTDTLAKLLPHSWAARRLALTLASQLQNQHCLIAFRVSVRAKQPGNGGEHDGNSDTRRHR